MVSNTALYKLIEEMGQEGMLDVPNLHGAACEACHVGYKTGCNAVPTVLFMSCDGDRDGDGACEAIMSREADESMSIFRVDFDHTIDIELVNVIKARCDENTNVKLSNDQCRLLASKGVAELFIYVTRSNYTQLEKFQDISDVKDYITSSVDFRFKLTQIISELKLEAEIALL